LGLILCQKNNYNKKKLYLFGLILCQKKLGFMTTLQFLVSNYADDIAKISYPEISPKNLDLIKQKCEKKIEYQMYSLVMIKSIYTSDYDDTEYIMTNKNLVQITYAPISNDIFEKIKNSSLIARMNLEKEILLLLEILFETKTPNPLIFSGIMVVDDECPVVYLENEKIDDESYCIVFDLRHLKDMITQTLNNELSSYANKSVSTLFYRDDMFTSVVVITLCVVYTVILSIISYLA